MNALEGNSFMGRIAGKARPDRWLVGLCLSIGLWAFAVPGAALAESPIRIDEQAEGRLTLVVRETEVREVFEMLARTQSVSIAVAESIEGEISVSLFDVEVEDAVYAVAQVAGASVERRGETYLVIEHDDLGKQNVGGATDVRAYKIQYSEADKVREILEKHLSRVGQVTTLEERQMVVVEDTPAFLARIERILDEIDRRPRQILLEAKVLEIKLDEADALGIDWSAAAGSIAGGRVDFGVQGFATPGAPGFFFDLLSDDIEGAIEALVTQGRARALASPRLLTTEGREAEVLVGQRLGFRVTTTINQVTTESIEFIESGVLLRFTPQVDRDGRILLDIHPEVSTGDINGGIPEEQTTEVTTQLIAESGERIFIGGLIQDSVGESNSGIPLLSRIPGLGILFGRSSWDYASTETIVLVRPTIQDDVAPAVAQRSMDLFDEIEPVINEHRDDVRDDLDQPWRRGSRPRRFEWFGPGSSADADAETGSGDEAARSVPAAMP